MNTLTRLFTTGPVQDSHIRGMMLMAIAMIIIPGIDVFAKLLGQANMSPGQVVWFRFFVQTLLITPIIVANRLWRLPPGTLLIQFTRGVLLAAATLFFFAALNYLSIAAAIAIFFVEPLVLTLISVIFLGEVIRIRRILAIIVGFLGALLVIRPSFMSVGLPALLPLATAVTFAFYLLLTRRISGIVNPFQMQWVVGISAVLVMSVALACGEGLGISPLIPSLPRGDTVFLVIGLGVVSTIGHLLIVFAMRRAPASLLAPFQYVEIIGATVFGYAVFGDLLDLESFIGVIIIIASGLYLCRRESLDKP